MQDGILILISLILFSYPIISSALPSNPVDGTKSKVVIIGAGVSGIGAASKLLQNGISDVTVLEAMDRIGGRINSIKLENDKGGVDIGAHWIHGQNGNIVYELVEPLDLVNRSGDDVNNLFFFSGGKPAEFKSKFLDLFVELTSGAEKLTVSEIKNTNLEKYIFGNVDKLVSSLGLSEKDIDSVKHYIRRNICTYQACDNLADVSFKRLFEYEVPAGEFLIEWKSGGMANIIQLLMGTHEKSPWSGLDVKSKIKLSSRVSKVDWSSDDNVVITTESGDVLTADYLIFTPSLNVLKHKHKDIFTPPLPKDKVEAIENLGMDVVDKVYLVFEKPWWPSNVSGFGLFHDIDYPSETQDWGEDFISFSTEHHNPHVLCGWLVGAAAKAMEQASDDEVKSTAMRILRKYLPNTYVIPEPIQLVRSRWWNTEDVRGSYSFNHRNADHIEHPRQDLAKPLSNKQGKPVVLFAGEATTSNHHSTVHGALETGWREADRIIKLINNKS